MPGTGPDRGGGGRGATLCRFDPRLPEAGSVGRTCRVGSFRMQEMYCCVFGSVLRVRSDVALVFPSFRG